jgi:hypothetical protein
MSRVLARQAMASHLLALCAYAFMQHTCSFVHDQESVNHLHFRHILSRFEWDCLSLPCIPFAPFAIIPVWDAALLRFVCCCDFCCARRTCSTSERCPTAASRAVSSGTRPKRIAAFGLPCWILSKRAHSSPKFALLSRTPAACHRFAPQQLVRRMFALYSWR